MLDAHNKKYILVAVVVVLLLGLSFTGYQFFKNTNTEPSQNQNQSEALGENNSGLEVVQQDQVGLAICSDRCGDGVCQNDGEANCDNLNCICAETTSDCPQDCPDSR